MSDIPTQEFAAILEEYKTLQSQIQKHLEQRQAAIGFVVAAMGGLMAFGAKDNALPVILALFAIIFVGGMITWAANFQVMRKITYLSVFIESRCLGMKWCTLLSGVSLSLDTINPVFHKLPIRKGWVPQTYTISYLLLACMFLTYSLTASVNQQSFILAVVGCLGTLALFALSYAMQRANSSKMYHILIAAWEKMKASQPGGCSL
jgi:predicted DNA-binding protein with PD1-like motif